MTHKNSGYRCFIIHICIMLSYLLIYNRLKHVKLKTKYTEIFTSTYFYKPFQAPIMNSQHFLLIFPSLITIKYTQLSQRFQLQPEYIWMTSLSIQTTLKFHKNLPTNIYLPAVIRILSEYSSVLKYLYNYFYSINHYRYLIFLFYENFYFF